MNKLKNILPIIMLVLLIMEFVMGSSQKALAASVTNYSITLTRLKAGTEANGTFKFTTPSGLALGSSFWFDFASGFDVSIACNSSGQWRALSYGPTTGLENNLTLDEFSFRDPANWAYSCTTTRLTFDAPHSGTSTIPAGSTIVFRTNTANSSTNIILPSSVSTYSVTIGGISFADTGTTAVSILADDQVGISATVDPILTFTVSDAAIGFGTFSGTNIRYATGDTNGATTEPTAGNPTVLTSASNANGGYTLAIKSEGNGTSAGLWSAGASYVIPAAASSAVVNGANAGYSAYVKNISGNGTFSVASGFNGATSASVLTRSNQTLATTTAPTNNSTFDLAIKGVIRSTTPAGSYTDTLTILCTPNF